MRKKREDFLPFGRPDFSGGEIEAVAAVMRTGWVGMGPETMAFERELAAYLGSNRVVAVNSCTSALFLSLLVHGIGPGDEVICPSFTWCSTANAALYLGARVVFSDIDPATLCITPESVAEKLSEHTRAVVVVHMGGLAADVEGIRAVLPDGVALIEDAAHALGARYADGNMVGSSGNLACFSFYANKNLSTGEGGAISVQDDELAERFVSLRLHGLESDAWKRFTDRNVLFNHGPVELGYKMNYTDLQAAIARVQLRRQSEFARRRLEVARRYHERLLAEFPELGFQKDVLHLHHARHLFLVILPRSSCFSLGRDELVSALRDRNIGAAVHYSPLHGMPLYAEMSARNLDHTEDIARRVLTLPMSGGMTLDDADDVLDALAEILQEARR